MNAARQVAARLRIILKHLYRSKANARQVPIPVALIRLRKINNSNSGLSSELKDRKIEKKSRGFGTKRGSATVKYTVI